MSRKQVLSPLERYCEIVFGLIMVLTFSRAINVVNAGQGEIKSMLWGALGCCIAWGLIDSVFYIIGRFVERSRERMLSKDPSRNSLLKADDFRGALGVFVIVALSTLPVVLPFVFFSELSLALKVSNAIALLLLFLSGVKLGKYAGVSQIAAGLVSVTVGAVLVGIAMLLGG